MLEPRKSDIPALFLVLVVLPVVLYIILGKWSESAKRKGRVNLIVEEPLEESYRAEQMAAASAVPLVVPPPTPSFRECARCHGPATTRCSRCKSVRYCSGKCQIIHWRQGHKEECLPPDNVDSYIDCASVEKADPSKDFRHSSQYAEYSGSSQLPMQDNAQFDVTFGTSYPVETSAGTSSTSSSAAFDCSEQSKLDKRISERRNSRKTDKEISETRKRAASISTDANLRSTPNYSKDVNTRNKLRGNGSTNSGYIQAQSHVIDGSLVSERYSDQRCELQPNLGFSCLNGESLYSAQGSLNEVGLGLEYSVPAGVSSNCSEDLSRRNNFPHNHSSNGSIRSKSEHVIKSAKSKAREVREQVQPAKLRKGHGFDESAGGTTTFSSAHEADGATRTGLLKSFGVNNKSKMSKQESEIIIHAPRNVKALFPFEVFTRFFELEIFDLAPRGLLNCGNSCYANAVLQCLTCTKPLVAYLLSRTHSRTCSLKNWCLMCELEQHVMALREVGGPLSPSRILSHMRGINCQIGDGSQEDAHEFLRLLVASMQSICLEEVGGENQVHPILHETTFVQQTFGGRLRSRVVCLTCHHESERYENIMDLTLEIFGWVESLEDALTQFTTFEDLDGDNMYRCGRCASYVRAKKQLRIDEAPNILTIVLKRFQEGNYGKINKCITFPDMLDMVRFMTGTNDIPPLYMLYGVVVHVDTLNASFSGHYVSYVKDLQGNWFRIDDSVVQPVPTSQVMSEGAYILFYKRSSPRPPRAYIRKPTKNEAAKHSKPFGQNVQRANRSTRPVEVYAEPNLMEYSDAASSDWSLFTSSDDASFTSESTRDSFSTVEYSDTCHADPFSSVFGPHSTRDRPSQRTVSCRMFSGSKPVTRYISEQTEFIIESDNIIDPLDEIHIGGYTRQVSVPFNEAYLSNSGYQNFVNYESSSDGFVRTFSDLHL